MNRYRKCTVTVVVENSFRLYNVTGLVFSNPLGIERIDFIEEICDD